MPKSNRKQSEAASRSRREFGPVREPFEMTNDEFGRTYLPYVRIASLFCSRSADEVRKNVADMLASSADIPFELLDDLARTRKTLRAIGAMLKASEARILVSLMDLTERPT